MTDYLQIINFVLNKNNELNKKYKDIEAIFPHETLDKVFDAVNNDVDVKILDDFSIIKFLYKEESDFVCLFGRDKKLDNEFEFHITTKPLQQIKDELKDKSIANLGYFIIVNEDEVYDYDVRLIDNGEASGLITKRAVRSRENHSLKYEPDSEFETYISLEEINDLFANELTNEKK